ncbi:MAG: hypothetical protein EOP05_03850 [Proteobacteria bacterium]|nr:MAG: hypothetical protein EOP05_03850 [Pseudomonadota bacterium]
MDLGGKALCTKLDKGVSTLEQPGDTLAKDHRMNSNLLIAGLLLFATLPTYAMGERPDLVVMQRASVNNIKLEKLMALEQAGILIASGDSVTVNIETLRDLIENRKAAGKAYDLSPEIKDLIQISASVSVPYGNT